ncbi:hypothetical protein LY76DRAFT_62493 [Colletotrichum caudatum]|nr:hypothetical protein LY76DRAFT_62493 [Colletotrichum caudatum]
MDCRSRSNSLWCVCVCLYLCVRVREVGVAGCLFPSRWRTPLLPVCRAAQAWISLHFLISQHHTRTLPGGDGNQDCDGSFSLFFMIKQESR